MATKQSNPEAGPTISDDITSTAQAIDAVQNTLTQFLDTANVNRVSGAPIRRGDVTIIPTAEVLVGLGFGAGAGSGTSPEQEGDGTGVSGGSGGGGGGGGGGPLPRRVGGRIPPPGGGGGSRAWPPPLAAPASPARRH
ncbi:MAG: hypothetical protein H8E35_06030, partial [Ardenticatenia bacterium]|nr:hypothetical protein [Ardenticatenia bacterium]